MAANEQKYGAADIGGKSDLNKAFREMKALLVDRGVNGLRLHGCRYGELSEQLQFEQEQAVALEVERYYKKAKEILALNTEFLEKVAQALAEKKLLTTMDIQEIKNSCKIVPVAL
jgi:ATP-dependent Zn protease